MKELTASATKEQAYQTFTCKIAWPTEGVFAGSDYSDTNAVCRSWNNKFLATADDDSKVNLF